MISAVRAGRCSANGAMIPCSLFTTARIPTILYADSEDIFLFEYGLNSKIAAVSWTVELTTSGLQRQYSERCYGVVANEDLILICEYGCNGSDPEIILYKRR